MLEEDVHRLPERVIENLDQLLMNESILRSRVAKVGPFCTRQGECHRLALACRVQRSPYVGVAFGRAEAHDHVVSLDEGFQPRLKSYRKIKSGESAFSDDDR